MVKGQSAEGFVCDEFSSSIINYSCRITEPTTKVDLSNGVYFMEAKTGEVFDPFIDDDDEASLRDDNYPFEANANLRMTTRGQILTYCTAIAGSQFRTHVVGVIILGVAQEFFAGIFPL